MMSGWPFVRYPRPLGFSVVELMAVLVIVIILLAIGIPSFASLIQKSKLSTTANDFLASINLTRSEAIQRGERVDMVPIDEAGDWAKGWAVFIDKNGNLKPDDGENLIFSHGPAPTGVTIKSNLTDSTVQYLAYTGAGRTRTNSSHYRTQFGTFTFQLDRKSRKIKLNFLGRPRICDPEVEKHTC